jgi:rsbT co-antagonist protein RsbR
VAWGDAYDEFVVRPSEETVEGRIRQLLQTDSAESIDLAAALQRLRKEVAERKSIAEELEQQIAERKLTEERLLREVQERTTMEQNLRSKLDIIRQQEEAIRAMSTPILQLWEGVLTMPVIGVVDTNRAAQMMENLLQEITKTQAQFTILDLTGVDMMDTSAADHLLKLVQAAGLLGAKCVVSGISPNMANAIVGLGVDLGDVPTFGNLQSALRYVIGTTTEKKLPQQRP